MAGPIPEVDGGIVIHAIKMKHPVPSGQVGQRGAKPLESGFTLKRVVAGFGILPIQPRWVDRHGGVRHILPVRGSGFIAPLDDCNRVGQRNSRRELKAPSSIQLDALAHRSGLDRADIARQQQGRRREQGGDGKARPFSRPARLV